MNLILPNMIGDVDFSRVSLAILAGGRGHRMGMLKSRLTIQNRPILQYLLEQIDWPGPTLLITSSADPDPPGGARFGRRAADAVEGQGPLRGVLTALQNIDTAMAIILTIDMPLLRAPHLQFVIQALQRRGCDGLMLRGPENQIEPFPLACQKSGAFHIQSRIDRGLLSVHSLTEDTRFAVESAPAGWDPSIWTNLNFPDDLQAFLLDHGGA